MGQNPDISKDVKIAVCHLANVWFDIKEDSFLGAIFTSDCQQNFEDNTLEPSITAGEKI